MEALLQDFEVHGAHEWQVEEDFYWELPCNQRYNPYEQPNQFTMGQLSEDVKEVQMIASGERAPVPLGLTWLSKILQLAGVKGPYQLRKRASKAPSDT